MYGKHNVDKFRDFCRMSAYSLALPFYPETAKQELKVFEQYTKEEIKKFDQLFGIMVDALETSNQDFLGEIFSSYEMGNSYRGQFFTPYPIALMMAKMQMGDIKAQVKDHGYVTICEPSCGSGVMIIAVRETVIEAGCNPSTDIYVEMTDVDEIAFLMAYIQISLYGIAAKVIQGNSLTREIYRELYTPVYFLNGWELRTAVRSLLTSPENNQITTSPGKEIPGHQLNLF